MYLPHSFENKNGANWIPWKVRTNESFGCNRYEKKWKENKMQPLFSTPYKFEAPILAKALGMMPFKGWFLAILPMTTAFVTLFSKHCIKSPNDYPWVNFWDAVFRPQWGSLIIWTLVRSQVKCMGFTLWFKNEPNHIIPLFSHSKLFLFVPLCQSPHR